MLNWAIVDVLAHGILVCLTSQGLQGLILNRGARLTLAWFAGLAHINIKGAPTLLLLVPGLPHSPS
jgi:hypothetical protein